MPHVYENSFNDDEDLCRVLCALNLGPSGNGQTPDSPPAATQRQPRLCVGVVDADGYPRDPEHWVEYVKPAVGSPVIPNTTENAVHPPFLVAHSGKSKSRKKYRAYVVFEGLQPGIYKTWYVSFPVTIAFNLMVFPGMRPSHWSRASAEIITKALPLFGRLSDATSLQVPLAVL